MLSRFLLTFFVTAALMLGGTGWAMAQPAGQDHEAHHPEAAPAETPAMPGAPGTSEPGMGGMMMDPQMMQMMHGRMMESGMMGGMRPGMTAPGQPAMAGPGMMMCPMMGGAPAGMMAMMQRMHGQGIGPGSIYGLPATQAAPTSEAQVRGMIEQRLAWHGNPRLVLGETRATEHGEIIADIVTQEGALVQRLAVDRRTGALRQVD